MAAARLHARACPRADRTGDTPVPVLGPVIPVACWVHVRRKFHDVYAARQGPVVQEALEQIAALYAVEKAIRGRLPDERRQGRKKSNDSARPVAKRCPSARIETRRSDRTRTRLN